MKTGILDENIKRINGFKHAVLLFFLMCFQYFITIDSDLDPVDVGPEPVQEQGVQQFFDAHPQMR